MNSDPLKVVLEAFEAEKNRDVEKASARIRDEHIFKEIIRLWKQGKNIFIVYGGAHTKNWEDKLKKLL